MYIYMYTYIYIIYCVCVYILYIHIYICIYNIALAALEGARMSSYALHCTRLKECICRRPAHFCSSGGGSSSSKCR